VDQLEAAQEGGGFLDAGIAEPVGFGDAGVVQTEVARQGRVPVGVPSRSVDAAHD
jgi:hypothetical protein